MRLLLLEGVVDEFRWWWCRRSRSSGRPEERGFKFPVAAAGIRLGIESPRREAAAAMAAALAMAPGARAARLVAGAGGASLAGTVRRSIFGDGAGLLENRACGSLDNLVSLLSGMRASGVRGGVVEVGKSGASADMSGASTDSGNGSGRGWLWLRENTTGGASARSRALPLRGTISSPRAGGVEETGRVLLKSIVGDRRRVCGSATIIGGGSGGGDDEESGGRGGEGSRVLEVSEEKDRRKVSRSGGGSSTGCTGWVFRSGGDAEVAGIIGGTGVGAFMLETTTPAAAVGIANEPANDDGIPAADAAGGNGGGGCGCVATGACNGGSDETTSEDGCGALRRP